MKPKLHFLCLFKKRMDSSGRIYYSATLGNSRLLLYPTAEGEMRFYLGGQVEPEKNLSTLPYNRRSPAGPV